MIRARTRLGVIALLSAIGGAACAAEDAGLAEADGHKANETSAPHADFARATSADAVAVSESALVDNTYAVGVVPVGPDTDEEGSGFGTTCPTDSSLVTFRMDDEDDDNRTDWTGERESAAWDLPQTPRRSTCCDGSSSYNNTLLRFCKVDGRQFKPLTTNVNSKSKFYAVLKLGKYCPNGSLEFWRYIDNEDDDPNTYSSGPIAPNATDNNTTLKFCFFRTGSSTMSAFPSIGIRYAVFHDYDGTQPDWVISKHWNYSDDEDDNNRDWTSPDDTSDFYDFEKLVGGSANTMFDFARVR